MSSSGRAPGLAASGLGFAIGGVEILCEVDLEVRAGELMGIIGPNGAGKTTLFNLLTGVYTPTRGGISLGGRDLSGVDPAGRARLGMGRTFQTSSLFDALSVQENARVAAQARLGSNLAFWHRPRQDDEASRRAAASLEAVGLAHAAAQPAGGLSHGDKRKLELALLLAGDARVLLLDEPMAGVHTEDVPELMELIGTLHEEGRTLLLVEHHMAVVLGLADRVAVLHHGRLLACGTPDEVIADHTVQSAYLGEPL